MGIIGILGIMGDGLIRHNRHIRRFVQCRLGLYKTKAGAWRCCLQR